MLSSRSCSIATQPMPPSRHRDLEVRVLHRVARPQPLGAGGERQLAEQRGAERHHRRARRHVGDAGRADVQADHGVGLGARRDDRVPPARRRSVGRPMRCGCSGSVTAVKPRSALRRISSAPCSGSARYVMPSGTMRSGYGAYHSSWNQSFHARVTASPSSGSEHWREHAAAEAGDLRREVDRRPHAVDVHVAGRGRRCRSSRGASRRSGSARPSSPRACDRRRRSARPGRRAARRTPRPRGPRSVSTTFGARSWKRRGRRPSNMSRRLDEVVVDRDDRVLDRRGARGRGAARASRSSSSGASASPSWSRPLPYEPWR